MKRASALPFAVMEPWVTPRITDWTGVMACAEEIHCIDSAPMHLVESVPTCGKLFFHRYARKATTHATLRKNWEVLD